MARCVHLQSLLSQHLHSLHLLASRALFSPMAGVRQGLYLPRGLGSWSSRGFSLYHVLNSASQGNSPPEDKVTIHFVNQDGVRTTTSVTEGVSLLNVVITKKIDINGFENIFQKMEPMVDEEVDMLDLAYGLTETSRLGCQVCVQKWMDGMTVQVPKDVKNEKMASTVNQ
ncbi:ferredoxin 1b isoform X2 [Conger conger]|uniref:ferredoxin 1b isoform X2 n=1 Tax=Conger conger TaxID=82655 RepID=UPI002A59A63B|nr:ferredoxin 1b isoform X2 [Conger conger]